MKLVPMWCVGRNVIVVVASSRISEFVQVLSTVIDWWTRFVSTSGVSFANDPDEVSRRFAFSCII